MIAPEEAAHRGDADGDGWTNLEEYLNGTNPTVADDPMADKSSEVPGDLSGK